MGEILSRVSWWRFENRNSSWSRYLGIQVPGSWLKKKKRRLLPIWGALGQTSHLLRRLRLRLGASVQYLNSFGPISHPLSRQITEYTLTLPMRVLEWHYHSAGASTHRTFPTGRVQEYAWSAASFGRYYGQWTRKVEGNSFGHWMQKYGHYCFGRRMRKAERNPFGHWMQKFERPSFGRWMQKVERNYSSSWVPCCLGSFKIIESPCLGLFSSR